MCTPPRKKKKKQPPQHNRQTEKSKKTKREKWNRPTKNRVRKNVAKIPFYRRTGKIAQRVNCKVGAARSAAESSTASWTVDWCADRGGGGGGYGGGDRRFSLASRVGSGRRVRRYAAPSTDGAATLGTATQRHRDGICVCVPRARRPTPPSIRRRHRVCASLTGSGIVAFFMPYFPFFFFRCGSFNFVLSVVLDELMHVMTVLPAEMASLNLFLFDELEGVFGKLSCTLPLSMKFVSLIPIIS